MTDPMMKIEVKTAAARAQILKEEEQFARWRARGAKANANREKYLAKSTLLHNKRVNKVRNDARSLHLAYGFLAGHAYRDIEPISYVQPNWVRVQELVLAYCDDDKKETIIDKFSAWIVEAAGAGEILSHGGVMSKRNWAMQPQPRSVKGQWMTRAWVCRDFNGDWGKLGEYRASRHCQRMKARAFAIFEARVK